jgi:hypothetical protein
MLATVLPAHVPSATAPPRVIVCALRLLRPCPAFALIRSDVSTPLAFVVMRRLVWRFCPRFARALALPCSHICVCFEAVLVPMHPSPALCRRRVTVAVVVARWRMLSWGAKPRHPGWPPTSAGFVLRGREMVTTAAERTLRATCVCPRGRHWLDASCSSLSWRPPHPVHVCPAPLPGFFLIHESLASSSPSAFLLRMLCLSS